LSHKVILSSVAGSQLDDLYAYLAEKAGEMIAETYVGGIQQLCQDLADFPHRGTRRDHVVVPGLRTIGYKRRVTIAFSVDDATEVVTILGVFYGGRDYERNLVIDSSGE
jgi:toxin ParE1/3/4